MQVRKVSTRNLTLAELVGLDSVAKTNPRSDARSDPFGFDLPFGFWNPPRLGDAVGLGCC